MEQSRAIWAIMTVLALSPPLAAVAQERAMPEEAKVYILWPPDGQVIRGAFWVRMGLVNAGVAPAGVVRAGTGHHHILVNAPLPALDEPIPNNRNHLHFGLGQTETFIELAPGRHTLQLIMGDADHIPHDPPVLSRQITIQVRAVK